MEFSTLPDLKNTGFKIIEVGLFYGGEHLEVKICRFLTFVDKMAMLVNRATTSEGTLSTG